MSVIKALLEEECERLNRMRSAYIEKINELPKGSIQIKRINGGEYPYLIYRENKKVITKYIGNLDKTQIELLRQGIEKRKHYRQTLRTIEADLKVIHKAIRP